MWVSLGVYATDLLVAGALGLVVAWVHGRGVPSTPDARSMRIALPMLSMITTLVILAIGGSVARALGLVGAMSIIRFRSFDRSTRDIAFVFLALASGLACGTEKITLAISGTLFISLATWLLSLPGAEGRSRERMLVLGRTVATAAENLLPSHFQSWRRLHTRSRRLGEVIDTHLVRLKPDVLDLDAVAALSREPGVERVELSQGDRI